MYYTFFFLVECLAENGRCIKVGGKWTSRKPGGCVENTCLSQGKMGIEVKIVPIGIVLYFNILAKRYHISGG